MIICSNHQDYKVPLISTMAWNSYEFWCPYCDKHEGMLGAGESVDEIKELKKRLKSYLKATSDYRHAMGVLVCAETQWEGEYIKPENLPQEEKDRLEKLRHWELNKKIENDT